MSNRATQTNTFERGLNGGIHTEGLPPSFYTDAINVELANRDGVMAVHNLRGDEAKAMRVDSGENILRSFSVIATYGASKEPRDSIIHFVSTSEADEFKIYLLDVTQAAGQRHLIYDDSQRPNAERDGLNIQEEMDAYHYAEGEDHFLYWVDGLNPPRFIRMHVEDPATVDNSTTALSPLYIANEPDCLLTMRLWPTDMPTINSVQQSGGGLKAGSYQIAYRYFNSETKQYSVISLLTNPVPVIQDDTSTTHTNDIRGYGPGSTTPKSLEIQIDKSHFHHLMYDAIQLYVVRKSGNGSIEILELEPSTEYYGTENSTSTIIYSGNERNTVVARESIQYADAGIETATTIEEENGRLFLGSPKFFDMTLPVSTEDAQGLTLVQELAVPVDPIVSAVAANQGYYDEMNCHQYRGYFRDEVYRFGKVYFNKFGIQSRVARIEFDTTSSHRYDSASHASTWNRNWADASVKDWKFASRNSQLGGLFATDADEIRAFGLRISNIKDHPSWAYGMSIVRRKRVKNILGQTPVIPASAVMGCPAPIDTASMENLASNKPSYKGNALYDYNGEQDTYWPMRLSQGSLKHMMIFEVDSTNPWKIYFRAKDQAYDHKTSKDLESNARVNAFYLYPLEYMANDAGNPFYTYQLNGSENISPIDLVLLKSFNFYRDGTFSGRSGTSNFQFTLQARDTYGWVFAPYGRTAYYGMNQSSPGLLLSVGTDTDGSVPLAPSSMKIDQGFFQEAAGDPIPLDLPVGQLGKLAHIKWFDNLFNLATEQIQDTDSTKYQAEDMASPGATLNQRSLIIIPQMKDSEPKTIYDPSEFLLDNYQAGAGDFDAMFDTSANGRPDLYADGINQQRGDFDTDNTDWHLNFASRTNLFSDHSVMDPGDGVPIWIANIDRGLSDDRYGGTDTTGEYSHTGTYHKMSAGELAGNLNVSVDIWGGDCYITRCCVKIAANHPMQDGAMAIAADDYQYIDSHGSGTTSEQGRSLQRVVAGQAHIEYIDLWVESEINGHYVSRQASEYPSLFRSRDAGHLAYTTDEDYNYPDGSPVESSNSAPLYLYNFGYSAMNEEQSFFSPDIREVLRYDLKSRVSFSNQRVPNSATLGFDSFAPADFFDLDSQFGRIQRLVRIPGKRMYAIQEDGIAELRLGQTISEDTAGNVLNISTGQVIGYAQYLSSVLDSGGAMGIQSVRGVAMIPGGVAVYDWKRNKIGVIGGGMEADSQFPYAEKFLVENRPATAGAASISYDPIEERIIWNERDTHYGLIFNTKLRLWETRLKFGVGIGDICQGNGSLFAVTDENRGGNTLVYAMYEGLDPSTYLGETAESNFEVPLNVGALATLGKVLYVFNVNANGQPTGVKAVTRDQSPQDESAISTLTKKRSIYHANPFVTVAGKRIRSDIVGVIIYLEGSNLLKVSSSQQIFRTETRHEFGNPNQPQ